MSPEKKKKHLRSNKTKTHKIVSFKAYKAKNKEDKPTPLKHKILLDIIAIIIVAIIGCIVFVGIGQYRASHAGASDKDALVTNYIDALNRHDKGDIKQCYYPYQPDMKAYEEDIERQISYATNQTDTENISWDSDNISTEWTEIDTEKITEILANVKPEEASLGISFVPLTQISKDGYTIHQEDVYQFIVFKTDGKWYLAAYMQNSRNLTKIIDPDGRQLSEDEVNKWLYSMSYEIGNDNVGYIYVDKSWVEIQDDENPDEYIKMFITNDYSSYLTMASVKDADVESIDAYTKSIIEDSGQDYGDIMVSEGLVGKYKANVQIAQNEENGTRIIIWTFKTDENDERTHVITLEAVSDYDASTYINTFHTSKTHLDDSTDEQTTEQSE